MEETELTRVKKELDELKTRIDIQQEQLLRDINVYATINDATNLALSIAKLEVIDSLKNTAELVGERGR